MLDDDAVYAVVIRITIDDLCDLVLSFERENRFGIYRDLDIITFTDPLTVCVFLIDQDRSVFE